MLADHPDLTIDTKYRVHCILQRLGKERGAMSMWWVLTRVIVVGSRRCAVLLSFHCNRKGPVFRWLSRLHSLPSLVHSCISLSPVTRGDRLCSIVASFNRQLPTPLQKTPPCQVPTLPHPLPGLHQVLTALLTAAVSTSQDPSRPIRTKENCANQ